jgi:hypothetical protein
MVKHLENRHRIDMGWIHGSKLLEARAAESKYNKAQSKLKSAPHVKAEPSGGGTGSGSTALATTCDAATKEECEVAPTIAEQDVTRELQAQDAYVLEEHHIGHGPLTDFLKSIRPLEHDYGKLRCPYCNGDYKNARQLIVHLRLRSGHNIPETLLQDSSLVQLRRLQECAFYAPDKLTLPETEGTYLAPAWDSNAQSVICKFKGCNTTISKRWLQSHFMKTKHADDPDLPRDMPSWLSTRDAVAINWTQKKGMTMHSHCRFELAHRRKFMSSPSISGTDHTEQVVSVLSPLLGSSTDRTTQVMSFLQKQLDCQERGTAAFIEVAAGLNNLRSMCGGSGAIAGAIELPEISIREEALTWKEFTPGKKQWPKEFKRFPVQFVAEEFIAYLHSTKHFKETTVYVQGLGYFMQMLDFAEGASAGEVLSSLWKNNTMRKLLCLPIFEPKHSFSGKISGAWVGEWSMMVAFS